MNNFFFLAILIGYARTFFNGFKMKLSGAGTVYNINLWIRFLNSSFP
jgi:hypothetical protein